MVDQPFCYRWTFHIPNQIRGILPRYVYKAIYIVRRYCLVDVGFLIPTGSAIATADGKVQMRAFGVFAYRTHLSDLLAGFHHSSLLHGDIGHMGISRVPGLVDFAIDGGQRNGVLDRDLAIGTFICIVDHNAIGNRIDRQAVADVLVLQFDIHCTAGRGIVSTMPLIGSAVPDLICR